MLFLFKEYMHSIPPLAVFGGVFGASCGLFLSIKNDDFSNIAKNEVVGAAIGITAGAIVGFLQASTNIFFNWKNGHLHNLPIEEDIELEARNDRP